MVVATCDLDVGFLLNSVEFCLFGGSTFVMMTFSAKIVCEEKSETT